MATTESNRAKRCKIYRNGDPTYLGRDFVLNRRKIRTLDSLLQNVTVECKASNAVRRLVTPIGGTRIKDLDDIQDNSNLVAVGPGPFKKLQYNDLEARLIPVSKPSPRPHVMEIKPVVHSNVYQRFSGRARKIPTGALTVFMYSNGREFETAHRLTFTHVQLKTIDWFTFLDHITDKVNLLTGACKVVYKMPRQENDASDTWEKVTDVQQLEHGKYYVAVGAEGSGLRRLDYGQNRPSFHTSPKLNRNRVVSSKYNIKVFYRTKLTYDHLSAMNTKNNRKSRASDTSNSTNTTTQSSATNDTAQRNRGHGLGRQNRENDKSPARNHKYRPPPNRRQPKPEDDPYHSKQKPVKHSRTPQDSHREVDYDKDEGGVYKAKGLRRETSGAQEVEETRDTQVELPIDQVEAEEVKEEEPIRDSFSPRVSNENDLTKQPSDDREEQPRDLEVPSGEHLRRSPSESEAGGKSSSESEADSGKSSTQSEADGKSGSQSEAEDVSDEEERRKRREKKRRDKRRDKKRNKKRDETSERKKKNASPKEGRRLTTEVTRSSEEVRRVNDDDVGSMVDSLDSSPYPVVYKYRDM